ncbi:MAG TPA: DUF4129 domain-containing protein [Actinomycetota bacterium]|nr:DUF4129 domain-containing protein [Actinomycetota bacterium]
MTKPEARELRACALAALAEAGVLALPLWLILTQTRRLDVGVMALAVPFVATYVGGAVLACRFRASTNVAIAAVTIAVLAGIWLGHGEINQTVFAVLVCLLVAFRLVALALRDWRLPIHAEVGWFALALGLEVMIAAGATREWHGPLLLIVPVFFVAAFASRASTVWSFGAAGELDEHVRAAWIRRALLATGALVGAMIAAVALSIEGGVFDNIGRWLTPAANAVASFLAWVFSQAARPVFWLVDRLGIDPERVRELLDSLRNGRVGRALAEQRTAGETLVQRILGLLVFAAIAYGVFRAIRRFRPPSGAEPAPRAVGTQAEAPLPAVEPLPPRPRFRREPPADTVRRWYAEALWALRGREIVREPWQTPAEFAPVVAGAVPSCADAFAELTRAYQDVRYGSLRIDAGAVGRLEDGQRRIMAAIAHH